MSNRKQQELAFYTNEGARLLLNTKEVKIVEPWTMEASVFFGRHTRWCTAARNPDENEFDAVTQFADLIYVLVKRKNKRFALEIRYIAGDRRFEACEVVLWNELNESLDQSIAKAVFKHPDLHLWLIQNDMVWVLDKIRVQRTLGRLPPPIDMDLERLEADALRHLARWAHDTSISATEAANGLSRLRDALTVLPTTNPRSSKERRR